MRVLVFEDEQVSRLYPITIGRPAYAISCGGFRLIDGIQQLGNSRHAVVRDHLMAIQAADFSEMSEPLPDAPDDVVLVINSRLVPSIEAFRALKELARSDRSAAVFDQHHLSAALLTANAPTPPIPSRHTAWAAWLQDTSWAELPTVEVPLPLFHLPHDVVRYHMSTLGGNLQVRLEQTSYQQTDDGVFLGPGARLGDYVVIDTRNGPIVLDEGATVGPYSLLSGPALIGRGARVLEHSAIKDGVAIGHTTKIGGEVEASVIEPFTNKQHHGFLGHSYLGSWINLGAGTCNSDLKNTYGEVKMDYGGKKVATGMQFLGCVVGDYAKSAINTGIFTGKTIGACSMVYGFVTTNVPSFVNYARLFGQVTELPPDVMIATQQRMFSRRNVEQRPCDEQLIRDMYRLTRAERQLTGGPLSL